MRKAVTEVRGDCLEGPTVSVDVPASKLSGELMVERLKSGDACEYVLYLTKEQLKASGFRAIWEPEEEWWSVIPDVVEVTVWYDEDFIFRYCFDWDRNVHEDDYYEYHDEERAAEILDAFVDVLTSGAPQNKK